MHNVDPAAVVGRQSLGAPSIRAGSDGFLGDRKGIKMRSFPG